MLCYCLKLGQHTKIVSFKILDGDGIIFHNDKMDLTIYTHPIYILARHQYNKDVVTFVQTSCQLLCQYFFLSCVKLFRDCFVSDCFPRLILTARLFMKTVTTHGTPELLLTVKAHSFESNEIMFGSMKRRALTSDDRHLDTTRSSGCESSLMLTLSLLV